eukprot:324316-Prymnesium_polylepis.1
MVKLFSQNLRIKQKHSPCDCALSGGRGRPNAHDGDEQQRHDGRTPRVRPEVLSDEVAAREEGGKGGRQHDE